MHDITAHPAAGADQTYLITLMVTNAVALVRMLALHAQNRRRLAIELRIDRYRRRLRFTDNHASGGRADRQAYVTSMVITNAGAVVLHRGARLHLLAMALQSWRIAIDRDRELWI